MRKFHSLWVAAVLAASLIGGPAALAATCPVEGSSNNPDRPNKPRLNRLKNRRSAPNRYAPFASVHDFLADKPTDIRSVPNKDISAITQERLTPYVSQGVVVEGYIVTSKKGGDESANCEGRGGYDLHVWLSDTPSPADAKTAADYRDAKAESMIVEPTPTWERKVAGLGNVETFNAAATQQVKVRVYGWTFYDPEHKDQLGKTRGSLWEIHPVTKVEQLVDGEWQPL